MNSVSAQEIKRRGIGAVDTVLEEGPVYVIKHNRAHYVVMSEKDYRQLADEPRAMRVQESITTEVESSQHDTDSIIQSEDKATYSIYNQSTAPDLTLSNLSAELYERLEHQAHLHHRNIGDEAIACLEKILMSAPLDPDEFLAQLDHLHQNLDMPPLTDEMLDRAKKENQP